MGRGNDNTVQVLLKANGGDGKYKLTKELAVKYTKQLLTDNKLDFLNTHKKQDDLCDAFLQGCYYLSIKRPKMKTI